MSENHDPLLGPRVTVPYQDPIRVLLGRFVPTIRGGVYGIAFVLMHVSLAAGVILLLDLAFWRRLPPLRTKGALILGMLAVSSLTGLLITHLVAPNQMFEHFAIASLFVVFAAFALGTQVSWSDFRQIVLVFMLAVLVCNQVGQMVGLQGVGQYLGRSENYMLSSFGLFYRTHFPFAFGINSYGTLMGLFLLISITLTITTRSLLAVVCLALSAFQLVATDSRGALLSVGLALPIVLFSRRGRLAKAATAASFVSVPTLILIAEPFNRLFGSFAREGVDVTSGRLSWWQTLLDHVGQNPEAWWLGFGLSGTSRLNISLGSLSQFSGYRFATDVLPGAHNLWLQVFLEGGLLKLVTVFAVFWLIFSRARHMDRDARRLMLCAIYMPLVGIWESNFDTSRFEMLFFIFAALGLAASTAMDSSQRRVQPFVSTAGT